MLPYRLDVYYPLYLFGESSATDRAILRAVGCLADQSGAGENGRELTFSFPTGMEREVAARALEGAGLESVSVIRREDLDPFGESDGKVSEPQGC